MAPLEAQAEAAVLEWRKRLVPSPPESRRDPAGVQQSLGHRRRCSRGDFHVLVVPLGGRRLNGVSQLQAAQVGKVAAEARRVEELGGELLPPRQPFPAQVADAALAAQVRQAAQAGEQVAEIGRVDHHAIGDLDELIEHGIVEGRIARPPDMGRQVVDQQRRDDPGKVGRRVPAHRQHDLLVADAVRVAGRIVAVRADAGVKRRAVTMRIGDDDQRPRRMAHAQVDQRPHHPVGRGLVHDGDDEVEHRCARVRQALFGDERLGAIEGGGWRPQ